MGLGTLFLTLLPSSRCLFLALRVRVGALRPVAACSTGSNSTPFPYCCCTFPHLSSGAVRGLWENHRLRVSRHSLFAGVGVCSFPAAGRRYHGYPAPRLAGCWGELCGPVGLRSCCWAPLHCLGAQPCSATLRGLQLYTGSAVTLGRASTRTVVREQMEEVEN